MKRKDCPNRDDHTFVHEYVVYVPDLHYPATKTPPADLVFRAVKEQGQVYLV